MDQGTIRIGAMCTIGPTRMVGFLKRFRRDVPSVTLTIRDAPGLALVDLLLEGEIDAAFIGLPDLPERLDAVPLFSEKYIVAFCPGHRFEGMDTVPLRELNTEDYLTRTNCEFPEHFNALGIPDPAADANVCYASEREDWIQAMILAGLGCAVMPEFLPTLPGIATRPLLDPEISRTIRLVTVAGRQHSPALRSFLTLARRHDWNQITP